MGEKFSFFCQKNCRSAAKTAFYVFTGTVWMKFSLEKKCSVSFIYYSDSERKKMAFYQLFYEGFSKSVFYISMGTIRRKIFSIILFRLSILFRTITGKKFGVPSSFFRQGWKNCILCLNRYNLRQAFRQKTFFCHFWATNKNFLVVKTAYYVPRGTF